MFRLDSSHVKQEIDFHGLQHVFILSAENALKAIKAMKAKVQTIILFSFSVQYDSLFKCCLSNCGLSYLGMKLVSSRPLVWPPIASVADARPAVPCLQHTAMSNTGSGRRLCCSPRLFITHKRLCLKPGMPPRVLHYRPHPASPQRTTC